MGVEKLFDLSGRIALITGGSKGIGFASARLLAEAGADIILVARGAEGLEKAATELGDTGRKIATIAGDISDEGFLRSLPDEARKAIGVPTILVNNAGGGGPNNPRDQDTAIVEQQFQFNVSSSYLLTALFAPGMEEAGKGAVINISSQAGKLAQPGFAAYGIAKAAMIQMTRNLAQDYAPKIRINAIAPAAVLTDALAPYLTDEAKAAMEDNTPLGRLAVAEDIASAALFLASDASSYITGSTLDLAGGAEWTTWPY